MAVPPNEDLSPTFQTLSDLSGPIVWSEFFGNENPVELDIGCGRGLFLERAAYAKPHRNWLGLERDYTEGRRSARKLINKDLTNARVLGGDARIALETLIPPHSVDACHVYFPDPWWKRRHKRRRIFTDVFVDQLVLVLKPEGYVHSWTDVEDYFHVIAGLMDHDPRFVPLPTPEERDPEHDMDFQTSFERKKRREGCTIYRGRWRLKPGIVSGEDVVSEEVAGPHA